MGMPGKVEVGAEAGKKGEGSSEGNKGGGKQKGQKGGQVVPEDWTQQYRTRRQGEAAPEGDCSYLRESEGLPPGTRILVERKHGRECYAAIEENPMSWEEMEYRTRFVGMAMEREAVTMKPAGVSRTMELQALLHAQSVNRGQCV